MPFDSNGVFSRVMNWTSDQQNGVAIECGRHDAEDNNFAEGFNETFCRDGRAAATGNFNLGNHKIQNLADGIAATDAVTKGQLDASSAAGVSLNTAQTITGEKTFTKEITEKVNMTRGTAPAASMYPKPYKIYDSADSMVGNIQFTYGQNMSAGLGMLVYNCNDTTDSTPAALQVYNVNGTKYATCPTPTEDTTGSIQIDTVGARNTKLGNYVTLGTAQTISGAKTFSQNIILTSNAQTYRHIYSNNSAVTKGTAPSTNTGTDIVLRDSTNSNIGAVSTWYNANGTTRAGLLAYTPTAESTSSASVTVNNYASGRADILFEVPNGIADSCTLGETNSTSSNMIPTKGWVNNPATATNVVHRSGNETIDGTKTFSDNVITEISMTRGTGHANDIYGGYGIHDSNGNLFASLIAKSTAGSGTGNTTPGNSSVFLRVYNPNNTSSSDAKYLQLIYGTDGSSYATCPESDKNGSIVTTVNKSKAAKGYVELGNGLIMQWGKVASEGNAYVTITFPKTFSSATSYSITATQRSSSSSLASSSAVSIYNPSATSVKVASRAINESSTNDYFYWIAIGY